MLVYNYQTGEILVKVSAPGFDPAYIPEDLETNEAYKGVYLDNTLSGSFTPGSIFKIVTAAAAMERYPDSWSSITYNCQGAVELAGSDITCLNGHAHGSRISRWLGHSATCTLPSWPTTWAQRPCSRRRRRWALTPSWILAASPYPRAPST